MSAKPIPRRTDVEQAPDERLVAVEVAADSMNLPIARPPIVRDDAVHVFVADSSQFAAWLYYLGGDVNRAPQIDGASLWTLRTETPRRRDGSTVRIRVHVALVHDELVPAEFRTAVSA
ncbi:hypothetical protein SUDANB1_05294 [Streptomyces sp. enrichment culture]|uniref:hypothetical protein n=1 Tax=Streptomyces sp. enrichment culture TaxID=1795815 RepID=UPI003F55934A